jgi:hypothetical protein
MRSAAAKLRSMHARRSIEASDHAAVLAIAEHVVPVALIDRVTHGYAPAPQVRLERMKRTVSRRTSLF